MNIISIEFQFIFLSFLIFFSLGRATLFFLKEDNLSLIETIIVGYGISIIYSLSLYKLGINFSYQFILCIIIFALQFHFISLKNLFQINKNKIFCLTLIILIAICTLGDETYKAFQGFWYDRFSYLSSALVIQDMEYSVLKETTSEIFSTGNRASFIIDPLRNRVPGTFSTRMGAEVLFSFLTIPFKTFSYLLANIFEELLRILIFLISYDIFRQLKNNKFLSTIAALSVAIGFHGQFLKDFNAWGMSAAIPMWLYIFNKTIINDTLKINLNKIIILAASCFIVYPEGSLYIFALFTTCILFRDILFRNNKLVNNIKNNLIILISSFSFALLIHPQMLSFIKRQINLIVKGGLHDAVKNVYNWIHPFSVNTNQEIFEKKVIYLQKIVDNSSTIIEKISFIISYIYGSLGIYQVKFLFLNEYNYPLFIPSGIIIFYFIVKALNIKPSHFKENFPLYLTIILSLTSPFILFFNESYYGWSRATGYSSIFIIVALYFILIKYSKAINIQAIILGLLVSTSLIFSSLHTYSKVVGTHNFNKVGYGFTQSLLMYQFTDVKDNYKEHVLFNTDIINRHLKFCDSIDFDVNETVLSVYGLFVIRSQSDIFTNYLNKQYLLTGVWDGHNLGEKKSQLNFSPADCSLIEVKKDNKLQLILKLNRFEKQNIQ